MFREESKYGYLTRYGTSSLFNEKKLASQTTYQLCGEKE